MKLLTVILLAMLDIVPAGKACLERLQQRDSILIADQLRYGVQLDGFSLTNGLALPDFKRMSNDTLAVVGDWKLDTLVAGKPVTARQRRKGLPENCSLKASIVLAPFEAGRFVLPDIPVVVAGRDGNDTLVFEGCEMEVCTIPVDTASFVIHDIKGQVKYPYTFEEVAPWLFALVLLAALIALLLWLIERLRRRGKQDPASNDPAHIVALRELEKYRSDRYWAPDKQKAFYSGITDALKTYIDARFGIDAPEMTTAELFDALKALPSLDKDMLASLRDMFETADFVKFARHTADDDANRRALPLAVSFVTATIPVESETEEKGEEARRS